MISETKRIEEFEAEVAELKETNERLEREIDNLKHKASLASTSLNVALKVLDEIQQ